MGNACLSPSLCQQQLLLPEIVTGDEKMMKTKDGREMAKNSLAQLKAVKVNTLVTAPKDQQQQTEEQQHQQRREKEQQQQQSGARNGTEGNGEDKNGTANGMIGGQLTMRDKEIIARCWRSRIVTNRSDLFHKTMLRCIEASPKLNEIIACGRYCYRDLTKWPKLNRICQAQFKFYERLIYELNMDERRMRNECTRLGQTHAQYAQFGLKPHFLDIYQRSLIEIISKMEFANVIEREETVQAFGKLIRFIIEAMLIGYSQRVTELRRTRRDSGGTELTDGRASDDDGGGNE